MKEDTKNKIKKIAKVSGFIITFGFAVFGVLCAAVLMANASGAKDNIKTLDSSLVQNGVRSERNIKPRKAPDYQNSVNLVDNAREFLGVYVTENLNPRSIAFNYNAGTSTWLVPVDTSKYYYFDCDYNGWWYGASFCYSGSLSDFEDYCESVVATHEQAMTNTYSDYKTVQRYYFAPSSSYFVITCSSSLRPHLYVCDTLEVPSQDVISLPAKWSPLGMFGGSISEDGNILTNTEWSTGYEEKITLKGFLFRNQGIIYNRMRIILYWLGGTGSGNTEIGYVDAKGDFHVGLSSQWCIRSIEYAFNTTDDVNNNVDDLYRFTAGQTRIDFTNTKVSVYPGIVWQNEGANVLEIIDKNYSSNGTRYTYGGLSIGSRLTDYEFLMKYNNIVALEVMGDTSLVFALMSSAFGSVTPLLSIAILPNITLGMLLFFPLVGAIIVIIIKVIKK